LSAIEFQRQGRTDIAAGTTDDSTAEEVRQRERHRAGTVTPGRPTYVVRKRLLGAQAIATDNKILHRRQHGRDAVREHALDQLQVPHARVCCPIPQARK